MKRTLLLIIIIYTLMNFPAYSMSDLKSQSQILINVETGRILLENNSHEKLYPASLTKLLTALVALDMGKLDDVLTVDEKTPFDIDGSHIALEPEEKITLNDLLHAMLITSANDAAEVIARNYSNSLEDFVIKMNIKAAELNMTESNFVNPHGLHNLNHYSTAYDLSLLAKEAYSNKVIREIVLKKTYTIGPTNKKKEPRIINTLNDLLTGTGYGKQVIIDNKWTNISYAYANGMKTGFTPEAKHCLISSAKKDNLSLIAVVLCGQDKNAIYQDTIKLLNYGFDNYSLYELNNKNGYYKNINVKNAMIEHLPLIFNDNTYAALTVEEYKRLDSSFEIIDNNAPINNSQKIGIMNYILDGKIIGSSDLISTLDLNKIEKSSILKYILNLILCSITLIVFLIISLMVYNKNRIKKMRIKKRVSKN